MEHAITTHDAVHILNLGDCHGVTPESALESLFARLFPNPLDARAAMELARQYAEQYADDKSDETYEDGRESGYDEGYEAAHYEIDDDVETAREAAYENGYRDGRNDTVGEFHDLAAKLKILKMTLDRPK